MKKLIIAIIIFLPVTSFLIGWNLRKNKDCPAVLSEQSENTPKEYPLNKYAIDYLSKQKIKSGSFEMLETFKETADYTQFKFAFKFDPTFEDGESKTTTGLINIPKKEGRLPTVLMIRGYANQETYKTGVGSINVSEYFANNGFITIAPDFLGYDESDSESLNIFETRFQTYTTILSLLHSIEAPSLTKITTNKIDPDNLFIWAHSNGGQIAITTLAITGQVIPTTLWAPVSKPFPYSILYYTDESDDKGKFIRNELAKFEEDYDVEKYSFINYLDNIKAPIQLHQGTNDDAVPNEWSDEFSKTMKNLDKDISYYRYLGADHNLIPSWDIAVTRDLQFFLSNVDKGEELLSN